MASKFRPFTHYCNAFPENQVQLSTISSLLRTPYFRKAQGAKDTLWELQYPASHGMNYRAICLLWQQRVVVLVMFKGSGSGGKIRHYFQQAIERAEDWKRRYP